MNAVLELEPSGRFIAKPETVGTTADEITAIAEGKGDPARVEIILTNLRCAAFSLGATTEGRC